MRRRMKRKNVNVLRIFTRNRRIIIMEVEGGIVVMNNKIIFEQLIPKMIEVYGDIVERIILYGSAARGTQTEESDIDILVILKDKENSFMKEQITDILVDFELEYNKVLSVVKIDYEKFTLWENTMPFYKNIKREGIILWQAA